MLVIYWSSTVRWADSRSIAIDNSFFMSPEFVRIFAEVELLSETTSLFYWH